MIKKLHYKTNAMQVSIQDFETKKNVIDFLLNLILQHSLRSNSAQLKFLNN